MGNDQDQTGVDAAVSAEDGSLIGGRQGLLAVPLAGHAGKAETAFQVLTEICTLIYDLGVEASSTQSREDVKGTVWLLTTLIPCLSCISALRQFSILFPNVSLQFVEQ